LSSSSVIFFVFEQFLDRLCAVTPHVRHGDAVVFGDAVQFLDQFLAPLLGQGAEWEGG